ncbi:hypothetical protein NA57DRAFT_61512 [Rhizodiscina lignyota]|uniref:Uncharacterized protein n=1 Tax=Rhizodiscina lignyota TaxID=1504668 RepID=A0A9P4I434_9PEZI|nr:hypothetical protein NA57DRAFT_61512 [Rhizodiscina lignyota]
MDTNTEARPSLLTLPLDIRNAIYERTCYRSSRRSPRDWIWGNLAWNLLVELNIKPHNGAPTGAIGQQVSRAVASSPRDVPKKALKILSGFAVFKGLPDLVLLQVNGQIRQEVLQFISEKTTIIMFSSDIKPNQADMSNIRIPPLFRTLLTTPTILDIRSDRTVSYEQYTSAYFGPKDEMLLLLPEYTHNTKLISLRFYLPEKLDYRVKEKARQYDDYPGPLQTLQWFFQKVKSLELLRVVMISHNEIICDKVWARDGLDVEQAAEKMKDVFGVYKGEVRSVGEIFDS